MRFCWWEIKDKDATSLSIWHEWKRRVRKQKSPQRWNTCTTHVVQFSVPVSELSHCLSIQLLSSLYCTPTRTASASASSSTWTKAVSVHPDSLKHTETWLLVMPSWTTRAPHLLNTFTNTSSPSFVFNFTTPVSFIWACCLYHPWWNNVRPLQV